MSYDVYIGPESFNYTSNVGKLFYDHIPDSGKGGGLNEIDGITGKQAVEILSSAFSAIDRTRHELWSANVVGEPKLSARYDAGNGWGSLIGALIFLAKIMGACAQHPRKRVGVSS